MIETRYDEMKRDFFKFHKEHPEVWRLFRRFTFDRISLGFKHYSSYAIFERIRWETDQVPTEGKDEFKMNNNFRPFYARAFMKKYPEHEGFFRVRHQKSKDEPPVRRPALKPSDFD